MAAERKQYRHAPGSSRLGRHRLLLGEDHLLAVYNRVFAEDYRRFYFGDVQSIVLYRTNVGRVLNIVLGLTAALWLLLAVTTGDAARIVFAVFFLLTLAPLVANAAMGPTCRIMVTTAVQKSRLSAAYRLRGGRRLLDELTGLIEARQGTFTGEQAPSASPAP